MSKTKTLKAGSKSRSLTFSEALWREIDRDAERCRRTPAQQIETVLAAVYGLEDIPQINLVASEPPTPHESAVRHLTRLWLAYDRLKDQQEEIYREAVEITGEPETDDPNQVNGELTWDFLANDSEPDAADLLERCRNLRLHGDAGFWPSVIGERS